MIRHTFFAIGLGMILFVLYLVQYTGAYKSVQIKVEQKGPYTVIYKKHVGPYHKIAEVITAVETWSQAQGLKCRLSFGEFYDDPRLVEEGRLNSRGGCLIDTDSADEQAAYEKIKTTLPTDFLTDQIPQTNAVIGLFEGAPSIGPIKVYPKAEEYIAENRLTKKASVIEIYEVFGKSSIQTQYIWPIQ